MDRVGMRESERIIGNREKREATLGMDGRGVEGITGAKERET